MSRITLYWMRAPDGDRYHGDSSSASYIEYEFEIDGRRCASRTLGGKGGGGSHRDSGAGGSGLRGKGGTGGSRTEGDGGSRQEADGGSRHGKRLSGCSPHDSDQELQGGDTPGIRHISTLKTKMIILGLSLVILLQRCHFHALMALIPGYGRISVWTTSKSSMF